MSCKEKGLKSSLSVCPLNNLQSLKRYFRLTLAFCQIVHDRQSLISVLQEFFASINIFILAGGLGTRLIFYEVLKLSWYSLIS